MGGGEGAFNSMRFSKRGEHSPLMIYSFVHFSFLLCQDLGQTQQHVRMQEREEEIKMRTDVVVQ